MFINVLGYIDNIFYPWVNMSFYTSAWIHTHTYKHNICDWYWFHIVKLTWAYLSNVIEYNYDTRIRTYIYIKCKAVITYDTNIVMSYLCLIIYITQCYSCLGIFLDVPLSLLSHHFFSLFFLYIGSDSDCGGGGIAPRIICPPRVYKIQHFKRFKI